MKKLPIGIQSFQTLREEDCVYIDKTPMLLQLAGSVGRYFLSRPRRFGKSLLVDTLKELFEGNQALFQGLYIEDKWDWSATWPVIRLDFADGVLQSREQLDLRITKLLHENRERLGVSLDNEFQDIPGLFRDLIHACHQQSGQRVVILIDEYDKPILDNIEQPEVAAELREGLKNLYSVMKGQDAYIQFAFMTGVSKFSKVSLFSGVNQLRDITLHPAYATLCGYTQQDLETSFAEHLAGVDWQQLKDWYNGYQFLGESVYNPFDILLFIDSRQSYRNYWFETGSPSFLLKLFRQKQYFLPELETLEVGEEILDSFDVENINPVTLLFQAGYLTIARSFTRRNRLLFELVVPNEEVRISLADQFINAYTERPAHEKFAIQDRLYHCLEQVNMPQLEREIRSLFAGIPWRNFTQNDLADSEGYYASVLYAFFASLNAQIIAEDISNKGQVDLTVILCNCIYVLEIKRDTRADYQAQNPNPALAQIQKQGYSEKYRACGKTLIELGLVFNTEARNLVQMDAVVAKV
jgi:hypothetical protein